MQRQNHGTTPRTGLPFVNRIRELGELRAGIESALSGRGQFFTISGEPGIGKSRLADEIAVHAAANGVRCLWGRSWERGGAPAYWPWIQVLRGLTSRAETESLAAWLGPSASEVTQIVPELRQLLPSLPESPSAALAEPEQARFRLLDSTGSFLRRAAEAQPLLIILDDLHAADATTLMMLVAFAREIRDARIALIGTYREAAIQQSSERAELLALAEREGTRLPLRGLGEEAISQLVEQAAGVQPPAALVALLSQKTDGNPFFLGEILRSMAAQGQLAKGLTRVPRQLRIPEGVRESIIRNCAPLGDNARRILTIAAVIGREFDLACLACASETPRDTLADLLDRAIRLELLTEAEGAGGRYSFRHSLIREALYDTLSATQRLKLHSVVGDAIRRTYDPELYCAALAYHYSEAAPLANADEAVRYSLQAAQIAEKQLAYEESIRHLRRALEVLPLASTRDDLLRAELLLELGKALTKAGELNEARNSCLRAADAARQLNQAELFARAVVSAGRVLSDSGTTDRNLVTLLREALDHLGAADSAVCGQVLARLGVELYWTDRTESASLCQRAVDIAKRLGDSQTSIIALWARHLALRNPDSLEQRLEDTREVIRIAEQAGERDFALEARYYRISDLLEIGDITGADREHQEYLKAEAELRDRFKRGLLLQGMRAQLDGRLDEAEALAQQAFAAGQQSRRPLTFNSFLLQTGHIMWEHGRLAEAEPTLRAYIAENPLIIFTQCAMLQCLMEGGKEGEARAEFERLASDQFGTVPRDWNWLPAIFVLGLTCANLRLRAHAEVLYGLLVPFAGRNAMLGFVYCYGSVHFALGRLALTLDRCDDAETHFQAALIANRRLRAAVWTAHTEYQLAALMLMRNSPEDVGRIAELIASARHAAQAMGIVRLRRLLESNTAFEDFEHSRRNSVSMINDTGAATENAANAAGTEALTALSEASLRDGAYLAPDGVVTILFSDMADSSLMFERMGDLRAQAIVRLHNEIIREQVALHKGAEVKTTGDGFMIAFSSARRALQCAVAIQRALAAYCTENSSDPIRVKMGLHAGEAIRESNDFFGKAVILASRIADLARAGDILVSSTLRDLTESAGDLHFSDVRNVELKGLSGTYQICRAIWEPN